MRASRFMNLTSFRLGMALSQRSSGVLAQRPWGKTSRPRKSWSRIAVSPRLHLSQIPGRSHPSGETAPIPVMATLRSMRSPGRTKVAHPELEHVAALGLEIGVVEGRPDEHHLALGDGLS